MKKLRFTLIATLTLVSLSVLGQKSLVNTTSSTVKWTGYKIGGSHTGTISINNGYLQLSNGNIKGGEVIIDMKTITDTDLTDEGYSQKLVGHLKSDDFFGVEQYPTASFKITKASSFKNGKAIVNGNITIKGTSQPISFEVTKTGNTYATQLKIDRSKFNVRYGSNSFFDNLGDKAIEDEFLLEITLQLK